ncbi:MAG: hypothetical protein LUG99_10430 [Lachnospiraceae bacterium]|nr:hypothetical protein [Lachnospiraceae bacterium]
MLSRNTDLLLEHGYAFPLHPHHYPSAADRRNGHFLIMKKKMVSTERKKAAWMQRLNTGLEMVHHAFEFCDNVVLSDEGLWFGVNYDAGSFLDFLPEDARQNGYRLKIVVYLRRQDQFLTSLWNQKVKYKGCSMKLTDFIHQRVTRTPLYVDYDATLRKIDDIIGAENIIVRRFEEAFWPQHSIYADFLDAVGLDPALPVDVPKEKVNTSLNANAVELQRLINSASFLPAGIRRRLSARAKKLPKGKANRRYMSGHLSDAKAAAFLARYHEGNDRVTRDFLRDGKPLFSDDGGHDSHSHPFAPWIT